MTTTVISTTCAGIAMILTMGNAYPQSLSWS